MLNSLAVCFCSTLWSKISNALKRLGFQSHNFLAQLLSETSRACTIRVRRSTLGRLWNELGSHAGLHHRHRRSRTAVAERIFGCGEPYPGSPDQGPTAPFGSWVYDVLMNVRLGQDGAYAPSVLLEGAPVNVSSRQLTKPSLAVQLATQYASESEDARTEQHNAAGLR